MNVYETQSLQKVDSMFLLKNGPKYTHVVPEEHPIREKGRSALKLSVLCILMGVIAFGCLIVGLVLLINHGQKAEPQDRNHTECGTSIAEFEANGCVFDILSYTWMPTRCVDSVTSGEFRSWLSDPKRMLGPWPFFKEVSEGPLLATNRLVNEADIGLRFNVDIWSSREEHLAHCLFMFLHISRVAIGQTPLWTADSHPHAEHCFHALWKGLNGTWNFKEENKANQKIELGITSC